MKRLIAAFISLMLIICLTGCTSDDLSEHKIQKINDLDTYVDSKTEEQYSQISIDNIILIRDNGKKSIKNSKTIDEVDNTFTKIISEMERIKSLNEIQKIKKIHYYVEQFMFIGEYHQLYDFETKSLFTKNIVEVDGNVDLDKEFEFVTTLDDEKINTFFINASEKGLFLLKDKYELELDTTCAKSGWHLTIEFEDGTIFTSEGLLDPVEADKIDTMFNELSGHHLFGI